jgi:hypothetical protein
MRMWHRLGSLLAPAVVVMLGLFGVFPPCVLYFTVVGLMASLPRCDSMIGSSKRGPCKTQTDLDQNRCLLIYPEGGSLRTPVWLKFCICCLVFSLPDQMSQLSPFDVGQIKAHDHHGLSGAAISRILRKPDGKSTWSQTAVQDAMAKLASQPDWRGEREEGSGRPRETTKAQDKSLVRQVFKSRGRHKVTVAFLRKMLPWTRKLSNSLLEDRLHEGGLKWMRRKNKMTVTTAYLAPRIVYSEAILRKHQSTLNSWAYTDGCSFFLDRTEEESEHSHLAALGSYVWRCADFRDAMYQECLGPSSYKKAQGIPVRVWGVLAQGQLHIEILEQGSVMNQDIYEDLIEERFEEWLGGASYLVQDFERCLRSKGPLQALEKLGVELVEGYSKCSQDFNAIENCWKILRDRLNDTMPRGLETRANFCNRLKKAVGWMNRVKAQQMWYLSTNQKERCRDCLSQVPAGGRTKW